MGVTYSDLGRYADAIAAYTKAISIKPNLSILIRQFDVQCFDVFL
jgi:cytochrome c-type biogenesis protein CcmH/NrfG